MYTRLLTLLAFIFINSCFISGQPIHYDYDSNGNRTKRYIIPLGKGESSTSNISENSKDKEKVEEFKEVLEEVTVKIYPNPTKGVLFVELSGLLQDELIDYQLFSQTGNLLETVRKIENPFTIDFNKHQSGMYILKLVINNKISQWKILKE